jgi:hypothetical protein
VTAQFSIVEVYTVATVVVSTTFCLFTTKHMTSLTFHVTFYEQIPMKLFQVGHPQISLLMGGNFTLLHLNNADILLKASKYGGKLRKGL